MSSYSFRVERFLDASELAELSTTCMPALKVLTARYLPEIDLTCGIPEQSAYLDALRTSWLLDPAEDRPEHPLLVQALGYAFGLNLMRQHGLRWAKIIDSYGGCLSLVGGKSAQISVPAFQYVEKREHLRNGEVFEDFFKQAGPELAGA